MCVLYVKEARTRYHGWRAQRADVYFLRQELSGEADSGADFACLLYPVKRFSHILTSVFVSLSKIRVIFCEAEG
jgi:hypothetical protein